MYILVHALTYTRVQYLDFQRVLSVADPDVIYEEHFNLAVGKLIESLAHVEPGSAQGKQVRACPSPVLPKYCTSSTPPLVCRLG